ncbi:hypothetical protein [Pseudobutyrivibrio xylanivorans]|uniref:Uncharacterized protein n=1 Tax=Pseudobutyrivibrio xylanivorans TaxID=185007 RepID=A0A5P6VRC5_PSEXY|nr:hypothetical protein [Pseudobutyrivibrio xylanivorans]QFJ53724.1 hypothetical protein FXF36_01985 [Pseudobutyrivibrio xylanivorans]
MISKKEICDILESKLEIGSDFIVGEFVRKPGMSGCMEIKGSWYLYSVDDHADCIFTGPFNDKAIVYACAVKMHSSKLFQEYRFSKEEFSVYMNNHFYSLEEME